nr:hypothetical protein [Mycoplasmopsis bovis]
MLKKQDKLGNLTESDFDFKLEKKSLLNRKGEISITSKSKSKLISGTLLLTIDHLQEVTPRKHKYSADKTEVLEIGYNKYGQIEQFDRNVKKVPKVLPEEVIRKLLKKKNYENIDNRINFGIIFLKLELQLFNILSFKSSIFLDFFLIFSINILKVH